MSNARAVRRLMARGTIGKLRTADDVAAAEGRLNIYRCPPCGGQIVTVDLAKGVTPATLACRATDSCEGTSFSLGYPPLPWGKHLPKPVPAFEWYRPDEEEFAALRDTDRDAFDHVVRGGLLLRLRGVRA